MNHKISIKTKGSLLSLDEFKTQGLNCGDVVGIALQTETIGMIISLDEWSTAWCRKYEIKIFNQACDESKALQTLNGLELTRTIAMQCGINTAAVTCWDYNKDGLQWYLPCIYELSTIAAYREEINEILEGIDVMPLNKDTHYWSSSENSQYLAWCVGFSNGYFYYGNKYSYFLVRAVAAFEPLVGSHDKSVDRRVDRELSCELAEEIAIKYLHSQGYTEKITKEINIK